MLLRQIAAHDFPSPHFDIANTELFLHLLLATVERGGVLIPRNSLDHGSHLR